MAKSSAENLAKLQESVTDLNQRVRGFGDSLGRVEVVLKVLEGQSVLKDITINVSEMTVTRWKKREIDVRVGDGHRSSDSNSGSEEGSGGSELHLDLRLSWGGFVKRVWLSS